ncbi:MAG: ABC transporter substrate-binding protein [Betaproteobacteria bacterium]|nr:ABC transporter substrate-binding protein [Betaproteobacteria bacterium]
MAMVVVPAHAQSSAKVPRVALILATTPQAEMTGPVPASPIVRAFLQSMRERGYVEGKNWILDPRSPEGHWDRTADIVADLVRLKTDVIVLPNTEFAARAVKVTRDVPMVVLAGDTLVEAGLARSLARPGGNVTGSTVDVDAGADVKRLELLHALVPKARRIAFIGTNEDWTNAWGTAIRGAAPTLGVELFHVESTHTGYESAFARLLQEKPDAFWIARSPTALGLRVAIGQFSRESGLPGACGHAEIAQLGCLMSYGFIQSEVITLGTSYVDRILKGAKPAELPIEQARRFEFVLNLKAARQIGLAVPNSMILRADRVIE